MDILIDFSGWVLIPEEDLKLVKLNEKHELVDVDNTNMTTLEVVNMLNNGKAMLKSFTDTYNHDNSDSGINSITFDIND